MGKLAELAKASSGKLKGPVTVSFSDGTQRTFKDEAEAEKETAGLELEHRRGAFFEKAKAAPTDAKAEEAPAPKMAQKKKG